ncbi:hypothetical protein TNCT_403461 [Trichonephila clavata]|uniref:Uncharacterized protein n=1 Tax=Trichonephila clavata TaxID=2740835 RepID=A0A8X6IEH4_TRICU|nr:hypothetical protein TNCT_403461 [Trichonephila clavata]
MPERSQGPPCRMEACVAHQVLKIFMDRFKPLFCCVMDAFSAPKVSCCPWTGWRHCMLSRESTVGNQFHCVRDLKHCIVILKRSSVSSDRLKHTLLNNEWDRGRMARKVARDIKSDLILEWACFERTFRMSVLGQFPCSRKGSIAS